MKKAKITRAFLALFAGLSVVSCAQKEQVEDNSAQRDVTFTVALNRASKNDAEVVVRHSGKASDTWFGFVTDDLNAPDADLIKGQLANVSKSSIHIGTSQTVAVKNLQEYTAYKYVAFAVTLNKEVYGKSASLVFSTNPDLDIVFAAEASEITTSSAAVTISHEGLAQLNYAGFLTTDLTTPAASLAAENYATLVSNGKITAEGKAKLFKGKSTKVTVENLNADTQYRYIAYGVFVNEEDVAVYYGTPADVTFATLVDYAAVTFTATTVSVGKAAATFKVSYNTNSDITWYAFNTADQNTAAANLIRTALRNASASDYKTGKNVEVSFNNLQPVTNYRIIVTGVKDGEAFGTPADVKYQTADEDYDDIVFSASFVSATKNSVTVKVSNSTGQDKFQWTYVASEDMNASAADLLPRADQVQASAIQSGNNKEITISDLKAGSQYRVIVAGYRQDGAGNKYIYGTPADLKVSTTSAFSVNDSWVLTYNGKNVYNGSWRVYLHIGNTNAKLGRKIFTKAEFEAASIVDPLINSYVDEVKAAVAAGEDVNDFITGDNESETQSWLISDPIAAGDYVVVIFDVEDDFTPKGEYKSLAYTVEASQTSAAYQAWLGKWITSDTTGEEIWQVAEKVAGETYSVTGVCGEAANVVLTAVFDPSNSSFILCGQLTDVAKTLNTSNGAVPAHLRLFAMQTLTSGFYTTNSPIFTATLSGETATVTPGTLTTSTGTSFAIAAAQFMWKADDPTSTSIWYDNRVVYNLPNTLKRPSSTGSAAYNAWLGNWDMIGRNVADTADSTFFTLTIAQDVADASYTISGWGGITGGTPPTSEGSFNSATGALGIKSCTLLTGQTINGINGICDVGVCGFFTYTDGNTYFDSDAGVVLANCSNPTGTVSVAQGEWSTGIYYVSMCMMAMPQGGTNGYRLWSNYLDIPFKMVKNTSGGSSVNHKPSALKAVGKPVRMGKLPASKSVKAAPAASVTVE